MQVVAVEALAQQVAMLPVLLMVDQAVLVCNLLFQALPLITLVVAAVAETQQEPLVVMVAAVTAALILPALMVRQTRVAAAAVMEIAEITEEQVAQVS